MFVVIPGFFSQGRCGADGTKEGAQGASVVLLHSDDLAINHGTLK